MEFSSFALYVSAVKNYRSNGVLSDSLLMSEGPRGLKTYYAPFDFINKNARVVLCGITPGLRQADAAIRAAQASLGKDGDHLAAMKAAKETGSFAGSMRKNLCDMLDHVGLGPYLGIAACDALFGERRDLVHYTSALRYPVLKNGENYSGDKDMVSEPYLWNQTKANLGKEIKALPDVIWIPLGQSVVQVFEKLISQGEISRSKVLLGLPHASGANAERIKYFIGQKPREALSSKVNADLLDGRKRELLAQINLLKQAR